MLPIAASGYSESEVLSALKAERGTYEPRYKVSVQDRYGNLIDDELLTIVDAEFAYNRTQKVRGGGSLTLRKQDRELDDYEDQIVASSPILYWKFAEASGTTAEDSSGNNRDGTYSGSPSLNQSPIPRGITDNGSVTFDGTNDYVTIADDAAFDVAAFTLECWARTTASGSYRNLLTRDDNSTNRQFLLRQTSADQLELVLFFTGAVTAFYQPRVKINDGRNYHIAVTYTGNVGSASYVTFYINGRIIHRTFENRTLAAVAQSFDVGRRGDNVEFWSGGIDEVAFYGAALPPSVIRAHYQKGAAQLHEIDFGYDRVKVTKQVLMPDGGYAEWARGVFLTSFPIVREDETGTRYEIAVYDKLKILEEYKFDDRYLIAAGTIYSTAIRTLLGLVFQTSEISVASVTATLPTAKTFNIGDNLLDAILELCEASSLRAPYADANGVVTIVEHIAPQSRAVDDTWTIGDQSFVGWKREVSTNKNELYNKVISRWAQPKSGVVQTGEAEILFDSHPASYANLGYWKTFIYDVTASDSGSLNSIAQRKLVEVSSPAERMKVSIIGRPYLEDEEKVRTIEGEGAGQEVIDYLVEDRRYRFSSNWEDVTLLRVFTF